MLEASETMLLIAIIIFPPRHSDVVWWSLVERSTTKWKKCQGFGLGPSFPPASMMRKEISKKNKTHANTCKNQKTKTQTQTLTFRLLDTWDWVEWKLVECIKLHVLQRTTFHAEVCNKIIHRSYLHWGHEQLLRALE